MDKAPDTDVVIFLPGEVRAKQADRSTIQWKWKWTSGRAVGPKRTPYIRHYPDPKVFDNARDLAWTLASRCPVDPLDGPVMLDVVVMRRWRITDHRYVRDGAEAIYKDTAPDRDNLLKQIQDVLQAAGVVRNDGQFVGGEVRKLCGPVSGAWLRLRTVAPDDPSALPDWCILERVES